MHTSHLLVSILIAQACALAGCNMVPGMANLSAKSAENPLSGGQALEWSHEPIGIPFEKERACTMWPIEDVLKVKATEAEICADGSIYKLMDAKFSPVSKEETPLQVTSDGSGATGLGEGIANGAIRAPLQKVGSCVDKSAGTTKNVWVARFTNVCIPNKAHDGQPVLTAKSTFLEVGMARWKFPATAPPSAPTAPPQAKSAP